ncbi:DNA mismatch repair ATPase msh1 [Pichia californica]|uniref:DNA mismatch repair ATPase msh1 n=1 Tax=Pichia californica TaxID=460514 RepID=A0A9P6WP96_9ASCO|nr:DNA mismatch repair ATPase msh1 [[Candida] californica]
MSLRGYLVTRWMVFNSFNRSSFCGFKLKQFQKLTYRNLSSAKTDSDDLTFTAKDLLDIKVVFSNDKAELKEKKNKNKTKTKLGSNSNKKISNFNVKPTTENLLEKEEITSTMENLERLNYDDDHDISEIEDRGAITDNNTYTDFYQNILDTYKTYSNRPDGKYIVLIHVGSFYELYFDHADKYSNLLGLTLTKKNLKIGPVSFSGFPDRMLDKYMDIIYKAGYKAVVCNQVLNTVDNTISRPVDRIMTPGIIIDESCRDFHSNNYLMSISFPDDLKQDVDMKKIGISWCDVNLGLFYILEIEFSQLLSTVTRINPAEILISDKINVEELLSSSILPEISDLKSYYITSYHEKSKKKSLDDFIWRFSDNKRLVSTTLDSMSQKEKSATSLLLHYLDICLPNYKTSFQLPTRSLPKTLMQIDSNAAQDLELLETLQSRKKIGALSHLIDKTVTSPGARLLNTWLLAPSTDLKQIKHRHDLLGMFIKDPYFLNILNSRLKKTADINRILRRIDNTKAERYEYLELSMTVKILDEIYDSIKESLNKTSLKLVEPIFKDFISSTKIHTLAKQIENTIDQKVSYLKQNNNKLEGEIIRDFWEIKDTASTHLKKLRKDYNDFFLKSEILKNELSSEFQQEGYLGSLKLIKDMKTSEYVIELKSTSKVIPSLIKSLNLNVKERSKSVTKLIDPRWSEIGDSLIKLEYDITVEEGIIMNNLNTKISKLYKELRKISPIIEILDVLQSFAYLSIQFNLTKPEIDESTSFEVIDGRHIVVEEGLKNRIDFVNFTVNDCEINSSQAWVITGPNMGGKSTFLRQNALIAILAQIGCYVPAYKAQIGIIDKIFTRVGSSDNIFKHQSTFMVEMNETAIILREATEKSLVIMDELGRGTSTNEGVAIAFATLLRLITVNKSKVLFATHFGPELMKLIQSNKTLQDKVSFYQTSIYQNDDSNQHSTDQKLLFDHKLKEGVSFHSHALKIAELAGFPKDVLDIAEESFQLLNKYE